MWAYRVESLGLEGERERVQAGVEWSGCWRMLRALTECDGTIFFSRAQLLTHTNSLGSKKSWGEWGGCLRRCMRENLTKTLSLFLNFFGG